MWIAQAAGRQRPRRNTRVAAERPAWTCGGWITTVDHGAGMGATVAGVCRISVALTEDQLADLRAAGDSGAYASTGEIVREALAAWRLAHALRDDDILRPRELWDSGRDRGATRTFNIGLTLAAARDGDARADASGGRS